MKERESRRQRQRERGKGERETDSERERKGRHRKRETDRQTERNRHRELKRLSIPCIRYGCEIFHIVVNRIAIMTFIFASKLENYVFIGFEMIY